MKIFKKELTTILSGFHSVISDLESFVTRVENLAKQKLIKADNLKTEAQAHLDEVATAKAVVANITSIVNPNKS